MKRLGHQIFANLFSSKGSIEKVETSKEVFTTSVSTASCFAGENERKKVKPW